MSLADQYQLTDRATKYAILLIGLTFMAFFAFESLTHRPLHPMQYLLVGLSLVLFYLVLLALSEHIGFTAAWLAASLSGAVMNGSTSVRCSGDGVTACCLSRRCCCWTG